MDWNHEQRQKIEKYAKGQPKKENLLEIPEDDRIYKCHGCHVVFKNQEYVENEKRCPSCDGVNIEIMCPLDNVRCREFEPQSTVENCPICGRPICPKCGCHDVVQISRVTGYLSDVSGWNMSKRQELVDRKRAREDELRATRRYE
jgi:hypothetical protein